MVSGHNRLEPMGQETVFQPALSSIDHPEAFFLTGLLLVKSPAFDQLSMVLVNPQEAGLSTGLLLVKSPAVDQLSMVLVDC
ncbi:hypothetical protein CROQUDRAFT_99621 [Cronartium quercuum f. sp. fusiforme G11]|uniref:Uncharacterized protein n=1 Tax=Cronartium quercuum f. sp. fusiforme G11 TaxID=708437 RepID=A0A9P6N6S6_9BASI|nr:hypothetical protein CROQUDRAFT_99621 [Cronartium quercuum f. sp. fusiforme G11]